MTFGNIDTNGFYITWASLFLPDSLHDFLLMSWNHKGNLAHRTKGRKRLGRETISIFQVKINVVSQSIHSETNIR